MEPKEVRRYLQRVALGLRDLGPFERRKALKEICSDLTDLAMDGMQTAPSAERLEGAARAMPPPEEVAQSYLASARPPLAAIRASCLVNLLLSLGPLVFGAYLLNVPPGMSLTVPGYFMALALLLAGGFGVLVYGLAIVSPARASRWRYAVLPAIAVGVILDLVFGTVLAVGLSWFQPIGFVLPIVFILGGGYSIAYAHGQLPRVVPDSVSKAGGGDYFRALDRRLRDLDLARREAIASELRAHLASAGVDLDRLPPTERRSAATKVLGPPEEVAAGYLKETRAELPPARRTATNLALLSAAIGVLIGLPVFGLGLWASFTTIPWWEEETLTPLGLLGSVGLLALSFAVLGGVLHIRRAPTTWPDAGPPTVALALASALVIAAAVGGGLYGGLMEPIAVKTFTIEGTHSAPDGELDLFWTSAPVDRSGIFPGSTGPPDGAWITRLDAQRNVLGIEPIPSSIPDSPLLALERDGGTWMALFATEFMTWGEQNLGANLMPPPGWSVVAGRLDPQSAAIAWSKEPTGNGVFSLRFESFVPPWFSGEVLWDRTYMAPMWQDARIALSADHVLAITISNVENDTYERSEVLGFLLDNRGNAIANVTLLQENVTRSGPDDTWNGTYARVDGVHAVTGGFWIVGTSLVSTGGTQTLRSWAAMVNATDGSVGVQELHRDEVPATPDPPRPGDRFIGSMQATVGRADGVLVATSIWEWITNATGGSEVDPSAGGMYATGLRADGALDFSVRLGAATVDDDFTWPLLAGWGGDPIVLVPHWLDLLGLGPNHIDVYEVPAPSRQVRHTNLTIGFSEAILFFFTLARMSPTTGMAAGPGIAEFPSEVFVEDCGLLGWRKQGGDIGRCLFPAPGLVRLDIPRGTSTVILLGPPSKPADELAGLVAASVAATLLVLAVQLGYPRLRAWRTGKGGDGRPSPGER